MSRAVGEVMAGVATTFVAAQRVQRLRRACDRRMRTCLQELQKHSRPAVAPGSCHARALAPSNRADRLCRGRRSVRALQRRNLLRLPVARRRIWSPPGGHGMRNPRHWLRQRICSIRMMSRGPMPCSRYRHHPPCASNWPLPGLHVLSSSAGLAVPTSSLRRCWRRTLHGAWVASGRSPEFRGVRRPDWTTSVINPGCSAAPHPCPAS